jgi:hypothetical protein
MSVDKSTNIFSWNSEEVDVQNIKTKSILESIYFSLFFYHTKILNNKFLYLADFENSKKNLYKKWMNVLVNERMNECTQTDRQTNREGERERDRETNIPSDAFGEVIVT